MGVGRQLKICKVNAPFHYSQISTVPSVLWKLFVRLYSEHLIHLPKGTCWKNAPEIQWMAVDEKDYLLV